MSPGYTVTPNTWTVLAGQPQFFKTGTTYDLNPLPGVSIGITADEVPWLNDMARIQGHCVLGLLLVTAVMRS